MLLLSVYNTIDYLGSKLSVKRSMQLIDYTITNQL